MTNEEVKEIASTLLKDVFKPLTEGNIILNPL